MIDSDPICGELLSEPKKFVKKTADRDKFRRCMKTIANEIVVDLNLELKELGEDFDYRDQMRDEKRVTKLANRILSLRIKLVAQGRMDSIEDIWKKSYPLIL
jgi:hypothetical protein